MGRIAGDLLQPNFFLDALASLESMLESECLMFLKFCQILGISSECAHSVPRVCSECVQSFFRVFSEFFQSFFRVFSEFLQSFFIVSSEFLQPKRVLHIV